MIHPSRLDRARAMRLLMSGKGWTTTRLAQEFRVSKRTVERTLALLGSKAGATNCRTVMADLPDPVRGLVTSGKLTLVVALELNRLDDKALVARLARDAVSWNWTVNQAYTAARARGAPLHDDDRPVRQPASAPIGDPEKPEAIPPPRAASPEALPPIVLPTPADYPVWCNTCGWKKLRSTLGRCPRRHVTGFTSKRPRRRKAVSL